MKLALEKAAGLRLPCTVAKHEFMVPTDPCEEPFPCSSFLTEPLMREGYFMSVTRIVIIFHSTGQNIWAKWLKNKKKVK